MDTENRALLILNGNFIDTLPLIKGSTYKYILAVDGSANYLLDHGITPDVIVGDLDSITRENLEAAKEIGINIDHRDEQETTDFDKAMRHLQEKELTNVDIIGHRGFRLDHELSVYDVLIGYAPLFSIHLIDDYGIGYVLSGLTEYSINHKKDHICSLIPLTSCDRVTIRGFKWSIKRKKLEMGQFISSSNMITEDHASINFHSGVLLVYLHHSPLRR